MVELLAELQPQTPGPPHRLLGVLVAAGERVQQREVVLAGALPREVCECLLDADDGLLDRRRAVGECRREPAHRPDLLAPDARPPGALQQATRRIADPAEVRAQEPDLHHSPPDACERLGVVELLQLDDRRLRLGEGGCGLLACSRAAEDGQLVHPRS